jgi:hypothetical protein
MAGLRLRVEGRPGLAEKRVDQGWRSLSDSSAQTQNSQSCTRQVPAMNDAPTYATREERATHNP